MSRWTGLLAICLAQALLLQSFLLASGQIDLNQILLQDKVNVILMVSDGFGPASEAAARLLYQHKYPASGPLPLDKILVGTSRTRPAALNPKVKDPEAFTKGIPFTDSAAGATAFSCAQKTYNDAVAVTVDKKPCGTVLEAAHKMGLKTGAVVTSRVTHATPASFLSHTVDRNMEDLIAEYIAGMHGIGRVADLVFGGGLCEFLPNVPAYGSCRYDEKDVLAIAKSNNFSLIFDKEQMLSATKKDLPLLGLFAHDHMAYDMDRALKDEPSLAQMTLKALSLLDAATATSSKGYLLIVEGSRIDMAAHDNDVTAHFHDIMAYQQAIEVVQAYVALRTNTVMISVSDHETGGLTIGRQVNPSVYPDYVWYPEVIFNATRSTEYLAKLLDDYDDGRKDKDTMKNFIRKEILDKGLGMKKFNEDIVDELAKYSKEERRVKYILGDLVGRTAHIGWTTHGHTGVDVNLYAKGYMSQFLRGNKENTDIGRFIAQLLNLDLQTITELLKNAPVLPTPPSISSYKSPSYKVAHYHH